ncbi:putative DNA metabolism protein [Kordia periserrulae]|uniref:Putative DNA metabolism protein n=1 Tax=Kordia periserrulae TaxID=701523 RepID=A0A2T6BRW1_9FLAO|nr:TIGR03915 family putative DNA repair protein [Kordia periserrulae]PTX58808.1 putative DNA metabolism protein [Kordia periserrulae]
MQKVVVYDGSFEGFLTVVFKVFEEKIKQVDIQREGNVQASFFGESEEVITNKTQADRVWNGLKKKLTPFGRNQLYYSFLSELESVENILLDYIQQVFAIPENIEKDFSNATVLKLSKIAKSVGREKHRMEAFVRFRLTKDGLYFASVAPDFNVLPLIAKHFKSRYADQKWVIYDIERKYGLYYNLENVETIVMDFPKEFDFTKTSKDFFAEEELAFQELWQNYFKSTNIESRKNRVLHVKHVPKRYWKYLSEKQPF